MPRFNLVRATPPAVLAAGIVAAVVCLGVRAEDAAKSDAPAFMLTFDEDEGESEAALRAVLARRVTVDVRDMPLREFFATVKRDCGIPTFVDEQALTDEGVGLDTPVTLKISGVSLKAVLRWVLEPLQLRVVKWNGVLKFTTAAEAVHLTTTRVYDVSDLIANEQNPKAVLDDLVEAIKANTGGPGDGFWLEFGEGPGIQPRKLGATTVLVIEHTDAVHEQIGKLFRDIRAALNLPTADRHRTRGSRDRRPTGVARSADRPQQATFIRLLPDDAPDKTAHILETLERRVAVDFESVPLNRVAETLSRMCEIPIFVNEQALVDEGLRLDTLVTLAASGITLREALNLSLRPLRLRALVLDETLKITTAAEAVNELSCQIYNVTDLVNHAQTSSKLLYLEQVINNNTGGQPDGRWLDEEGEGRISHLRFRRFDLLVIRQTEQTQREIDQLLHDLRSVRARSVIPITP